MADPTDIPHIMGIVLGGSGVANTLVIALNQRTGEKQRERADGNSVAIFDALNFESGYSAGDVIEFHNVGGSVGSATITINSATGGFQEVTITGAAASTVSVSL